jgi:hypothetical protein
MLVRNYHYFLRNKPEQHSSHITGFWVVKRQVTFAPPFIINRGKKKSLISNTTCTRAFTGSQMKLTPSLMVQSNPVPNDKPDK